MFSSARALIILAIIVALSLVALWIYRAGGEGVTNAVERRNNDAANQSDRARSDYDRCLDGGGVWNSAAGKC